VLCKKMRITGDSALKKLAQVTTRLTGADLSCLASHACTVTVERLYETLGNLPAVTQPLGVTPVPEFGGSATTGTDQVVSPSLSVPVQAPVPPESRSTGCFQRFRQAYPHRLTREQLDPLYITFQDFQTTLRTIQSSKSLDFATVPDLSSADIGALEPIRIEM